MCQHKVEEYQNAEKSLANHKSKVESTMTLLNDIVTDGAINNVHLRMLVDII